MTSDNSAVSKLKAACPCGGSGPYEQCCKLLHTGSPAASAEALMRSRYSAFYLDLPEYIARSWHHSTRPQTIENRDVSTVKTQWVGLRIKRHRIIDADHALVEFVARYKIDRQIFTLHEISRFVKESDHWFYLDGTAPGR